MSSCVFCNIVSREVPADIIYEDTDVLAFYGLHFMAPVHALVIPKKHIESIMDIKDEDQSAIYRCHVSIQQVAKKLGIAESGFRVITNIGKDGQQEVPHLHYHVIGGRELSWHM
ncbi:histidine triad nucleotide-binding protein [Paenibacillus sp. GCM10023252]|uniref:histidine triad nucleotide-binding protein n=1 Tax=Paenibacillus sp. GCM10023252 TaxID=3252649 RepID=UPI00360BB942